MHQQYLDNTLLLRDKLQLLYNDNKYVVDGIQVFFADINDFMRNGEKSNFGRSIIHKEVNNSVSIRKILDTKVNGQTMLNELGTLISKYDTDDFRAENLGEYTINIKQIIDQFYQEQK